MKNILSDYADIISSALFPMIIAILALGFPLLLQTVTRIDDKYKSTKLIETFVRDRISKFFIWVLIASVSSYIIWLFQLPPLVKWGWLIDYSALILVIITTLSLIISLFLIVYLTYIYYSPEKLLKRLINRSKISSKRSSLNKLNDNSRKGLYLEAISKLLNYSIQSIDEPLAEKLWEFYFSSIVEFRKNKKGQEIVYPNEYYNTFLEANEILCEQNKRAISRFNNNDIFDLFLDGYQETVLSKETYSFLWKIIIQSLHYKRKDFVLLYWRKAHQHFNLFMRAIYPQYDYTVVDDSEFRVINKDEVSKRDNERNEFLEFHYALGGLLMFKKEYKIIKEIMYYTQQHPPKYVLVPERMEEVIKRFMAINSGDYYNPVYYEKRYPFPDLYGVNLDDVIRMWIKKYLSVLFLRQYSLPDYYTTLNRLAMPNPPDDLSELKRWMDELNSLKIFVNELLSQKDTLEELGLGEYYISNWFDENNKVSPTVLIDDFKKGIKDKFSKIKSEQPISNEKDLEFKDLSVKYLTTIFDEYLALFNNNTIENYRSHYIYGRCNILNKTAFADNQDVSYINSDSITAESVGIEFEYYAINTFIIMNPKKYFLMEKEVFLAIDRLNITIDKHLIISVGLNIAYFSRLNIDGLMQKGGVWYYKEFEILEVDNYSNDIVSQSLFIIQKTDLPYIIFRDIPEELKLKYKLEKPNNNPYNIYTQLLDLNSPENLDIKNELDDTHKQEDLSVSVLACIKINAEIQYKPNANCVQIKAFSKFDDRGKSNKLEDVVSIE